MATGYCTRDEYKTWANVDSAIPDGIIDRAIAAVARGIDNFTKRNFRMTAGVRVFDTCDSRELDVDDVISVSQVATDGNRDGVYETVWATSDYQLWPLNPNVEPEPEPYTAIIAVGGNRFPAPTSTGRVGLVQVTGVWGWQNVPAAVNQAALILTQRTVGRRNSPEGQQGFDEYGTIRISSRDDPDAVRFLEPYRKIEFGVA